MFPQVDDYVFYRASIASNEFVLPDRIDRIMHPPQGAGGRIDRNAMFQVLRVDASILEFIKTVRSREGATFVFNGIEPNCINPIDAKFFELHFR